MSERACVCDLLLIGLSLIKDLSNLCFSGVTAVGSGLQKWDLSLIITELEFVHV